MIPMRKQMQSPVMLGVLLLLATTSATAADIRREKFTAGSRYLVVEALRDDLIHFELSEVAGGPDPMKGIHASPMVAPQEFPGPSSYRRSGNVIETAEVRVTVEPENLCVDVRDTARNIELTRICGESLDRPDKTLRFDPKGMRNVYGLGNFFFDTFTADGDWSGREWRAAGYGNVRRPVHGAAPSESQFPVLYALGEGKANYAFFFDNPYRMSWDFRNSRSWSVETWGDHLRFYVIAGGDLKALRSRFMELTGKPLIPPRSMFGLWVSKFGYLNWDDIRLDLDSLRMNRFPVDGFALDLQWFGGAFNDATNARMGTLWFDKRNFPHPLEGVRRLEERLGVSLMLVEESYVDARLEEYRLLSSPSCFLARSEEKGCVPVQLGSPREQLWWGYGGMIDWTDRRGGKYWHDLKRHRLSLLGITSHWLDLGEPEMFSDTAWYHGVEPGKNRHIDIHNLYNFLWAESIDTGYRDPKNRQELMRRLSLAAPPRYFSMSRAGSPGIQRLGGGLWSGDIGRNMGSLRAHLNTQMHMSLAGIDYYNSDVGGYIGTHGFGIEPEHTDAELYTQWFADSALGEIPLRPHGWSYSGEIPTFGPDRQGHRESNRENLLQRYELFPYLYSLAHRAWRHGEPIFPPLVYHFQEDPNVRRSAGNKMIGESLLYGVAVGFGQTEGRVYLPGGRWAHYNTLDWYDSAGEETVEIPFYLQRRSKSALRETAPSARTGYLDNGTNEVALTLPLFAREGAIIPVQRVDGELRNISGLRPGGGASPELRVKVFPSARDTSFTLYEDDGRTLAYQQGEVRETLLRQRREGETVTVRIGPAHGRFRDAPPRRRLTVAVVTDDERGAGVDLNGRKLPPCPSPGELESTVDGCWIDGGRNLVEASAGSVPVEEEASFRFTLQPVPPRVSAHFVCDSSTTQPGEGVYVTGSVPQLGSWDPRNAVRLTDIRYPRWSAVVGDLPPLTPVEWKCMKRDDRGEEVNLLESGLNHSLTTPRSGFAGTGHGALHDGAVRAGRGVTK